MVPYNLGPEGRQGEEKNIRLKNFEAENYTKENSKGRIQQKERGVLFRKTSIFYSAYWKGEVPQKEESACKHEKSPQVTIER